ncbi:MAG: hypothetical protein ABF242_02655 [Flavobacteriales bacterium]
MSTFPIGNIVWEHPEAATKLYQVLQETFGYPAIEPLEDEINVRGKFYAIAFAYVIKEYREIITTYEDWEERSQEQAEIGINLFMNPHKEDFCKLLKVEFEWAREAYWSAEEDWPEFDYSDVHEINESIIFAIQKIICKDIISHFKTKRKVLDFFFSSFKDVVSEQNGNFKFDYNKKGESHDFMLFNLNIRQIRRRETTFWNKYVKGLS